MTDRKTTRVQIELPEKAMDRLKRLKDQTEAGSYAEVIRNALISYEAMLVRVDDAGAYVASLPAKAA